MKLYKTIILACITAVSLFISSSAFAVAFGGKIVFGSPASEIPTLSGSMLIIMSLLIAAIAYQLINNTENKSNHKLIISLLIVGLISFGTGSIKLINHAYAGTPVYTLLVAGGEIDIRYGIQNYQNQTGILAEIKSITMSGGGAACDGGAPTPIANECVVGRILANLETCVINCVAP